MIAERHEAAPMPGVLRSHSDTTRWLGRTAARLRNYWQELTLTAGKPLAGDTMHYLDPESTRTKGKWAILGGAIGSVAIAVTAPAIYLSVQSGIESQEEALRGPHDRLPGIMFEIDGEPATAQGYDSLSPEEAQELGAAFVGFKVSLGALTPQP